MFQPISFKRKSLKYTLFPVESVNKNHRYFPKRYPKYTGQLAPSRQDICHVAPSEILLDGLIGYLSV